MAVVQSRVGTRFVLLSDPEDTARNHEDWETAMKTDGFIPTRDRNCRNSQAAKPPQWRGDRAIHLWKSGKSRRASVSRKTLLVMEPGLGHGSCSVESYRRGLEFVLGLAK